MSNQKIGATADFCRAGEARFTVSFALHIFYLPLLSSSCGLLPNYYRTKTQLSVLCLF
jgi:hypothetical protein